MANAFQTIKNKMGKGDTNLKRKWQMVRARGSWAEEEMLLGGRGKELVPNVLGRKEDSAK